MIGSRACALLLLAGLSVSGCGEEASPPDRRPWRCYTLEFGAWRPDNRLRLESMPSGVELDAVLIDPATPQLGLRINALAGQRIVMRRSWRPLVPDTIEMRFAAPEGQSPRDEVVVRARTDERTISGVAVANGGATSVVRGLRVPCR